MHNKKNKATLHPKWDWNIYAQIITIVVGIYTILTPPFFVLKYVFSNEVEKAIKLNNESNLREHERIKGVIIEFHPSAYQRLYTNMSSVSFVPDESTDKNTK